MIKEVDPLMCPFEMLKIVNVPRIVHVINSNCMYKVACDFLLSWNKAVL